MSKLRELIEELCLDGVEYKKLKDISIMKRGTSLTKAKAIVGAIPVISGGKEPAFYCSNYNRIGANITVAGSGVGAGYVQYWDIPIFANDCFTITGITNVSTKFIYYFLNSIQDKIYSTKKGGGVPHVHISDIEDFLIPLPPLPIQQEIVRILDSFTELEAELEAKLEAELEARKKQYEYYRNKLLSFEGDGSGKWMKLGEITELKAGKPIPASLITTCQTKQFPYICYGGNGSRGFVKNANQKGEHPLIGRQGALCGNIVFAKDEFYATEHAVVVSCSNAWLPKFAFYILKEMNLNQYKSSGAQPGLSICNLLKLLVPVPPLEKQRRIVSILDRFDFLCHDLSIGLPAEIAARKKQYEYYRDKLLTFKEKKENIA